MASRTGYGRVNPVPVGIDRDVYVVTNRTRDVDGNFTTSPHAEKVTRFCRMTVFIPAEVPKGGSLKNSPPFSDPNQHVYIKPAMNTEFPDEQSFYAAVGEEMTKAKSTEILVFTPGFRSRFSKHARIAGKMARDMDFKGPILLYSWAAGKNLQYFKVQEWLRSSIPPLVQILRDVKERLPNAKVVMIGHSMGSKLLVQALSTCIEEIARIEMPDDKRERRRKVASELAGIWEILTMIRQIVLAASDLSIEAFREFCDFLILEIRQGIYSEKDLPTLTVYCSRDDFALAFSKIIHLRLRNSQSRLGRTLSLKSSIKKGTLDLKVGKYDFVDIVDCTGLYKSKGNHSYYYKSDRCLDDMKAVFNGVRALARAGDCDQHIHFGYTHQGSTIYAFIPAALQASGWTVAWHSVLRWKW